MHPIGEKYLRKEALPFLWCPGCGNGTILGATLRAIDQLGIINQVAPTTPYDAKTTTSPHGNPEVPFDACELAKTSGATYVARWTTAHPRQLSKAVAEAISHEGFAFIEVLTQCPTQAGRIIYGVADPATLLDMLKSNTITTKAARKKNPEELKGKLLVGTLFHDDQKPEFGKSYYQTIRISATSPGD